MARWVCEDLGDGLVEERKGRETQPLSNARPERIGTELEGLRPIEHGTLEAKENYYERQQERSCFGSVF